MSDGLTIKFVGHVKIVDDLGNTLLDQHNAIHTQNMARVITRALANEGNFCIGKVAFGNGGTFINSSNMITYRPPNDGLYPDLAGWRSQLYNQTYYERVDDSLSTMGQGPGAVPSGDPSYISGVSGPGVRSYGANTDSIVRVEIVLNENEPRGQYQTSTSGSGTSGSTTIEHPDTTFTFDEIGLFTNGASQVSTNGYQEVDVNIKYASDDTGLQQNTNYSFQYAVNGGAIRTVTFNTGIGSGSFGAIVYADLVSVLNTRVTPDMTVSISDGLSVNTNGYLRFTSSQTPTSTVISTVSVGDVAVPGSQPLFSSLTDFAGVLTAVPGSVAGLEDMPTDITVEAERMLTHIIFSPVRKAADRTLRIVYTITCTVAPSEY